MTKPDLTAALTSPSADATLRLYRDWAASYETGFVAEMQYRLPGHVAAAFVAAGGRGPVLDVGAGTGLLAENLRALGVDCLQGFVFGAPAALPRTNPPD